jgi:hypothetical protein
MRSVAVFLIAATGLSAEADAAETQLWNEIEVSFKPTKRLELNLGEQLRLDRDLGRVGSLISVAGADWRALPWLSAGLAMRYELETSNKGKRRPAWRIAGDLGAHKKLAAARLSYRLRLQHQWKQKKDSIEGRFALRHKLRARWRNKTPVSPSLSFELFTRFDEGLPNQLHKLRSTLAAQYKLSKRHRLRLFLRLHQPIARPELEQERIIGLAYHHRFRP